MKLVVGLGNPGLKYRGTRHNVGFDVADLVASRQGLEFETCPVAALIARKRQSEFGLMLAKPLTFMNLSGEAVQGLCHYYRIEVDDLLIVADDVNLPLGRLRVRRAGSDGGHNGLGSIISVLGTDQFVRFRIGVGRGDEDRALASHVLAKFEAGERRAVDLSIDRAADAVELFVEGGIDMMMERYNRRLDVEEDSSK